MIHESMSVVIEMPAWRAHPIGFDIGYMYIMEIMHEIMRYMGDGSRLMPCMHGSYGHG
jgi:hypothetical protein